MIKYTDQDFMTVADLKNEGKWPLEHNSVRGLIPYISRLKGPDVRGIEIGTERGESAYLIMEKCPNIFDLTTIDPYVEYSCWNGIVPQDACDRFEEIAKENLKEFYPRCIMMKATSKDAASMIADNEYSFVYIDGNDSMDNQIEDMNLFYPKLKVGGLFCGHNYQLETVRYALKDFRESNKIRIPLQRTESFGWFWYKA